MPGRRLPRVAGWTLLFAALLLLLALLHPPSFVAREVAVVSSPWLMDGPEVTDVSRSANVRRVIGAYVQHALAARIADRAAQRSSSDVEVLYNMTRVVQEKVLNQVQLDHIPRSWPVLVSGVGYCDQLNAAVATIAAYRFPSSQIYALYDPVHKTTPHTIGRVWSAQRREWLYFDAFFEEPVIFTKVPGRHPHFLNVRGTPLIPSRTAVVRDTYDFDGWVLTEFKPGFVQHLLSRMSRQPKAARSAAPAPALAYVAIKPPVPLPPRKNTSDAEYERISRSFVRARVADLMGEPAREEYERIANDPAAAGDDRAAEVARIARKLAELSTN